MAALAKCLMGPAGGGKVTVEGLSPEVLLVGSTVTVKQGSKVVKSVAGSHYQGWIAGGTVDSEGNYICCDIPGVIVRANDAAGIIVPNPGTMVPGGRWISVFCNKSFRAVCYTHDGTWRPNYNDHDLSNGEEFDYIANTKLILAYINHSSVMRVLSVPV